MLSYIFHFQKKFEGTRVQVETFLAWKSKFDSELSELKQQKEKKPKDGPKKLTGTLAVILVCTMLRAMDVGFKHMVLVTLNLISDLLSAFSFWGDICRNDPKL